MFAQHLIIANNNKEIYITGIKLNKPFQKVMKKRIYPRIVQVLYKLYFIIYISIFILTLDL